MRVKTLLTFTVSGPNYRPSDGGLSLSGPRSSKVGKYYGRERLSVRQTNSRSAARSAFVSDYAGCPRQRGAVEVRTNRIPGWFQFVNTDDAFTLRAKTGLTLKVSLKAPAKLPGLRSISKPRIAYLFFGRYFLFL